MKKIFLSIVLTLAMVSSFMACQEYKIDSQPEAPLALQVDAQDTYTLLATSPSQIVFNVSSNTPWTIESDQQWCVPSPAMSAASALVSEIIVTTEDNNERNSRTATLTVSAEGVAESVVITVVQASKENLVVVPYDGTVSTDGGTFSFTIVSNKPWEIIPSTAFISNIDKKSGDGIEGSVEETVKVTVPANAGAKRRGTLTVQTEFDTYSFEVVQSGFVLELAGVPTTNIISLEGGGIATEFTTEVNSNLDWKAQVPAEYSDWLTVVREGNTIKVLASMNNRMTARKGQFLLTTSTPRDGFEGVVYYVEQPCAFKFNGDYTIDETTGNLRMMISKQTMLEGNFHVTKGRLKVEYEEVKISGSYAYGMYLEGDGTNYNYKMNIEDGQWVVRSGGTGVNWWSSRTQKTFDFLPINDMRTFEFVIEDDPSAAGKLRMFMYLNDMELDAVMKGKDNPFNGEFKGMLFKIASGAPVEGDYIIIKSITYSPVE